MAIKSSIRLPISNTEKRDFKNSKIGTIIKTRIGTLTSETTDNNMTAANKSKNPKIFTILNFIGLRIFLQAIWEI